MTAHKRSGRKSPEEFWSKVLAAPKVKRILEKRGFDPEAFRRDYEADTTRGPRVPKRPTKQEMDAVEAFQRLASAASRPCGGAADRASRARLR